MTQIYEGSHAGKGVARILIPGIYSETLLTAVEAVFDVPRELLLSNIRRGAVALPRQVGVFVMLASWGRTSKHTWNDAPYPYSWATIMGVAAVFRRDHTTAMYAMDRIPILGQSDPYLADQVGEVFDRVAAAIPEPRDKLRVTKTARNWRQYAARLVTPEPVLLPLD